MVKLYFILIGIKKIIIYIKIYIPGTVFVFCKEKWRKGDSLF